MLVALACRFGACSLELGNQIASIERLLEELERFPHTLVVQSGALCRNDGDDIIAILWAAAENLHRDYIFGGGDRNRRSAQVRGLHPRVEQLLKPGATKHDVSVDARREMNERKNASISDEVCVSPTQLEAVPFQGFYDRRYCVVAGKDGDIDVGSHSHGTMDERGLGTKHVPVRVQHLERAP
jgi:hypothetical protein